MLSTCSDGADDEDSCCLAEDDLVVYVKSKPSFLAKSSLRTTQHGPCCGSLADLMKQEYNNQKEEDRSVQAYRSCAEVIDADA